MFIAIESVFESLNLDDKGKFDCVVEALDEETTEEVKQLKKPC